MEIFDTLDPWLKRALTIIAFLAYALIERWFGRTTKTSAGSLLDFLGLVFGKLLGKSADDPQLLLTGHIIDGVYFEEKKVKTLWTIPLGSIGTFALTIDNGKLRVKATKEGDLDVMVSAGYPVEKILEPVKKNFVDKIKGFIPGNWDDALIDQAWKDSVAKLSELEVGQTPEAKVAAQAPAQQAAPQPSQSVAASQPAGQPSFAKGDINAPDAPVLAGVGSVQGLAQL